MDCSFDICSMFGDAWLSDDRNSCALLLYPHEKRTKFASIWLDIKLIFHAIGLSLVKKGLKKGTRYKDEAAKRTYAYLWFIGVDPIIQNRGVGSKLLKEVIVYANKKSLPLFLETSTIENLPWYKKFGFHLYEQIDLSYKLYFLKRQHLFIKTSNLITDKC